MSKELAVIANIIGSIYFMSGTLIQHQKAQELIVVIDKGFKNFLLELKEKKLASTIQILLHFFAYLTGAAFVGILLMAILNVQSQMLTSAFSILFLVSGLLSGALFWVLKHKQVLKQVGQWLLFIGGGSVLLPVIDILTGSEITHNIYSMMQISFSSLVNLPSNNGLVYEASIITGFYSSLVIVFYALTWLYAAPVALIAWAIIAIPILSARAINRAFPKEPIVIIFFTLWLFSFLYFSYV